MKRAPPLKSSSFVGFQSLLFSSASVVQEVVPALPTEIVIFILKEKNHFDHFFDLVVRRRRRDWIGELVVDLTGCSKFDMAIAKHINSHFCTPRHIPEVSYCRCKKLRRRALKQYDLSTSRSLGHAEKVLHRRVVPTDWSIDALPYRHITELVWPVLFHLLKITTICRDQPIFYGSPHSTSDS
jgi:hypothetical protein